MKFLFRVCWTGPNISERRERGTFPQSEAWNMNNLMVPPESILSPPYNALSPHFADPNGFEE